MNPAASLCPSLRGSSDQRDRWWSAFPSAFFRARVRLPRRGSPRRPKGRDRGLGDWGPVTDAKQRPGFPSPLPSMLSVGRWTLSVSSLLSARVSYRISDSYPDDRLSLRNASGRCISASSLAPACAPERTLALSRARDVSAVRSLCGPPTAQVRSRLKLKLVLACSPYVSVVAAVSAAVFCTNAVGTPAATVKTRDCGLRFLGENRRSVCEKTLLQNQFSEGKCRGRSGVE